MFDTNVEIDFFRELFGYDVSWIDFVKSNEKKIVEFLWFQGYTSDWYDTNPNVVCWLPGGIVLKRYPHTLDRYSKLRRFISWTTSGRGFTLSNYTSWFNPIKRNYYWLPQDNSGSKWVAWPYKNEISGQWQATVHPQHIVTGPKTSVHPVYPTYKDSWGRIKGLRDTWYHTEATTFFPIMIYPWSYYDDEDHTWAPRMEQI